MQLSEVTRYHLKRFMAAWDFVPHDANETSPHRNVYANETRTQRIVVTSGRRIYLAKNDVASQEVIASYQVKGAV